MGGEESALPYGCVKSGNGGFPVSDQITISLHGKRRSGKTTLLRRMRNIEPPPKYEPTPTMQSMEFLWKSMGKPDEMIKITVWEVVERAIRGADVDPNVILPDAMTVDTFKTSDGIIVMYDPNDDESARYAVGIVNEVPEAVPILVIANFLDTRKYEPCVHELMEFVSARIVHIQVSSLGMRGLSSVASWLDEPLIYHRKLRFQTLADEIQKEMAILRDDLRNMSATIDADLYDARPSDDPDVVDDAVPLEFRVDATETEFEPRRSEKGSAMKIRLDGL